MALQTPRDSLVFEITSRKQTILGMLGLHTIERNDVLDIVCQGNNFLEQASCLI